jgi:hypothetical protein
MDTVRRLRAMNFASTPWFLSPSLLVSVCGALLACSNDQQLGRARGSDAAGSAGETQTEPDNTSGAAGSAGSPGTGGIHLGPGGEGGGGATSRDPSGGEGGTVATGGSGGGSTGGAGPDDPIPIFDAASYSRLTIRSSGGMPFADSPESECDHRYEEVWVVDAQPRELTWDYCGYDRDADRYVIERGARTLTDLEYQAVLNTASLLAPVTESLCGEDKPLITAEIEADGASHLYVDEFNACDGTSQYTGAVQNIDPLATWLRTLASGAEISEAFDALDVWASPVIDPSPDPSSTCDEDYNVHYSLEVETRELVWDDCRASDAPNLYERAVGSRVLSADELDQVLSSISDFKIGASGPCPSLVPSTPDAAPSPAVVELRDTGRFTDESASCLVYSYSVYVVGAAELRALLATLAG